MRQVTQIPNLFSSPLCLSLRVDYRVLSLTSVPFPTLEMILRIFMGILQLVHLQIIHYLARALRFPRSQKCHPWRFLPEVVGLHLLGVLILVMKEVTIFLLRPHLQLLAIVIFHTIVFRAQILVLDRPAAVALLLDSPVARPHNTGVVHPRKTLAVHPRPAGRFHPCKLTAEFRHLWNKISHLLSHLLL